MRCRISEDVYQFTLLFFVPDVVYLFICPLLFYVRGCLSVHCPLKLNVWWCVPIHVPTTAVYQRESTCPFFYHFCMIQVVNLFTFLPLPHVRGCIPIRLPSSVVRQDVYLSICNLLSVWWCLPVHLSSNCMSENLVHCPQLLRMSTLPFALHCSTITEDSNSPLLRTRDILFM